MEAKFSVSGMTCSACSATVDRVATVDMVEAVETGVNRRSRNGNKI